MNKLKTGFLSRKKGIYLSVLIGSILVNAILLNEFFQRYGVQSPVVLRSPIYQKEIIISPLSTEKPTSLIPVEVANAEAPDVIPSEDANAEIDAGATEPELKSLVLSYFPANERDAADTLIFKESSWNPHAVNPSSGATGLFQALPWSKTGCDSTDDIKCQAAWGAAYVESRYGSAQEALSFHGRNGWY
jgi:soluble lytic murein transglycosylase-like protein